MELLLERPAYRRRWKAKVGNMILGAGLNQKAVCEVLAEQAWEEGFDQTPRQLKDRVSRALGPRPGAISGETLRWFIGGFAMTPEDAQYLWSATDVDDNGVTLLGSKGLGVPPPRDYRTVTAQEIHRLGPDGIPYQHRSNLILEATDRFSFYPFISSTDAVSVEPMRGARIVGKPYKINDELTAVNIRLHEPVLRGETVSLEYVTQFLYVSAPPPEFRRGVAITGVETLEICVCFHPECLPTRVWWCTWAGLEKAIVSEEPVRLESDGSVTRVARRLSGTMVGFRWSFEGA
ncbi:hypothetical protein J2T22_004227 [Pseudarthrobacter defluvii]|uniref:Uncharacterized protein n=1 Tax=Pseudarthrobacter defluvii TaxID=410837 RepID=A0ABT9URD4_9MICC|nr:hypothetical protein [Pseudarthrobacter defluvii]MDQ0121014.1 hypothetical protein [Pseudarthrobacter defluvii]